LDSISNINDQLEKKIVNSGNDTFHETYQQKRNLSTDAYTQSGPSLNLSYDSRDNVANPYKGRLASASYRINTEVMGSTADSTQLWLEYRDYFSLSSTRERNILAFWTYGWFVTSGDVPYLFLPATGWDMFGRSARPYTTGRFRGEDLSYTELEWRFPLQKNSDRFGGVLFSNMTSASNPEESVNILDYLQFGYGVGLRYMLEEESRVNIALDYGRGFNDASGVFLNLNESF
jgi:outer membrane protein assembly factor BamA